MSFDPRAYPASQNPFADKPQGYPPYQPDINPYASPAHAVVPAYQGVIGGDATGLWRQGNLLVMHKAAPLPDICLFTNEPTTGRLKRNLRWHHPAVFLALLANLLIYALLAIALSKTATICIGISDEWRRRRIRRILLAWATILVGIGVLMSGIVVGDRYPELLAGVIIGGIVLIFAGAIGGLIGAQLVTPKRITNDYVFLKGVCPAFLNNLPEFPYKV